MLDGAAPAILLASIVIACAVIYIYSYLVFRNGNKPLRSR